MARGYIHFDLCSVISVRYAPGSPGMVAEQREGGPLLPLTPITGAEMSDESRINMEIIINYVVMDRDAFFWLGNQLVSGGGLPDVKKKKIQGYESY